MKPVREHWFDMDHTLIENDCDVSWKDFVVAKRLADESALATADAFYQDYLAGTLDAEAFARFQLAEFAGRSEAEMAALAREHFETVVRERVRPKALARVREAAASGCVTAILTSTNLVLARPVAEYFGVDYCHGAELELVDGRYTGRHSGNYPVGAGKVLVAERECARRGVKLDEVAYYGDSFNDRFILAAVGAPFAVNPDDKLRRLAETNGWPLLNFRGEAS